jgi:hypothetical protein
MNNIEEQIKEIDNKIVDLLRNHGPDGHCDGHEMIAEYIISLLKQQEQEIGEEAVRGFYKYFTKEVDAFVYEYNKGKDELETYLSQQREKESNE